MQINVSKLHREVDEIEKEFRGMLLQHWHYDVARRRFEVIWDEVNAEAVRLLGTDAGAVYVALLCRMQHSFDEQYRSGALLKENRFDSPAS